VSKGWFYSAKDILFLLDAITLTREGAVQKMKVTQRKSERCLKITF
jgi:hypothetical protein